MIAAADDLFTADIKNSFYTASIGTDQEEMIEHC